MDATIVVHESAKTQKYGFLASIPIIQKEFNINVFTYPFSVTEYVFKLIEKEKQTLDYFLYDDKEEDKSNIVPIETFFKNLNYDYFYFSYTDYYNGILEIPKKLCWITNQEIENKSVESLARIFRHNAKNIERLVIVCDDENFTEREKIRYYKDEIEAEIVYLENIIEYNDEYQYEYYYSINPYVIEMMKEIIKESENKQENIYDFSISKISKFIIDKYVNLKILQLIDKDYIYQLIAPYIEIKNIVKFMINIAKNLV